MIRTAALGLLALLAGLALFLIFANSRPADFHIERSIAIDAPAAAVFPLVNDLRAWRRWSPWEKLDPAMQREYAGATAGEGAVYTWKSNSDAGAGRMTITASQPREQIAIKLEFRAPMQTTNDVAFYFEEDGDGTQVTWAMDGTNDFVGKVFALLMDVDGMVGKDFEAGLATLKTEAERDTRQRGGA